MQPEDSTGSPMSPQNYDWLTISATSRALHKNTALFQTCSILVARMGTQTSTTQNKARWIDHQWKKECLCQNNGNNSQRKTRGWTQVSRVPIEHTKRNFPLFGSMDSGIAWDASIVKDFKKRVNFRNYVFKSTNDLHYGGAGFIGSHVKTFGRIWPQISLSL